MSLFTSRILLLAAAVSAATISVSTPQYTATRLNSLPGYSVADARGVSNGKAVGFAGLFLGSGYDVPVVWDLATGAVQPLQIPAGYIQASGNGIDGNCIAGSAFDGGTERAVCWEFVGGVWTPMVLDNGGAFSTVGYAVSGTNVVGGAINFFPNYAALWTEADATPGPDFVNLSPTAGIAICNAISGSMKVGGIDGIATTWDNFNNPTALAMTDTSSNVYTFSEAMATNGVEHGGFIDTDQGVRMAAYWNSTGLVTLHQPSWLISVVRGMNTTAQVGFGTTFDGINYVDHAFLWNGNASGVDLHQFLPAGYVSSIAASIDAQGNIVGTANTASGEVHAFVWRKPSFTFGPFCPPVNDPASPPTVVKRGAVVPLIIKLFDGNGVPTGTPKVVLSVEQLGIGGGPINTDTFDTVFDLGPYFRYVGLIGRYMYLMSTRDLTPGRQYKLTATVEGTSDTHSVVIGVR